jgi:sugar phosphate permease
MSYVGRTAMAIAGPEIIREFGLTETQMGTVYSALSAELRATAGAGRMVG